MIKIVNQNSWENEQYTTMKPLHFMAYLNFFFFICTYIFDRTSEKSCFLIYLLSFKKVFHAWCSMTLKRIQILSSLHWSKEQPMLGILCSKDSELLTWSNLAQVLRDTFKTLKHKLQCSNHSSCLDPKSSDHNSKTHFTKKKKVQKSAKKLHALRGKHKSLIPLWITSL